MKLSDWIWFWKKSKSVHLWWSCRWNPSVKRNFWLRAMCTCTECYSTCQIRWENWWL